MNKANVKVVTPQIRFKDFISSLNWRVASLESITIPVEERVKSKKHILLSLTSGVGLVSQIEKFGREIAGESYKNYLVIQKYDFAYNKSATKQYPEGFIAIQKDYDKAALPSSIFTCFRIVDKECVPEFFNYLFFMNYHGKWLKRYISVGARAHGALNVNTKYLWQMPIAIPVKEEQEKIVECLKSIDDLIIEEEKKLIEFKKHKKGLLQKLFPQQDKTIPELRFPQFCQKWNTKILEDICIYKNGGSYENDITENGKYNLITLNSIDIDGNLKSEHRLINSGEWFLKKDDIVMVLSDVATGNFLGLSAVIPTNNQYVLNQRMGLLRVNSNYSANYIRYYINQNQKYFKSYGQGASQKNLSKKDILSFSIRIPINIDEQEKIVDCLSSIDDIILAQTAKIEALKQHKKGLLQGLFPSVEEVLYE